MINFQKDYDMTRVAVEIRKFKQREKRCRRVWITTCSIVFLASVAVIVYDEVVLNREGYDLKQKITVYQTSLVLGFFLVTATLFFISAHGRQNAQLKDHFRKYVLLSVGILAITVNALICTFFIDDLFAAEDGYQEDETQFCVEKAF